RDVTQSAKERRAAEYRDAGFCPLLSYLIPYPSSIRVTHPRYWRERPMIPITRSVKRCPMSQAHRREFLQEVGGGMMAVLVGSGLAAELGLAAEDNREGKPKTSNGLTRLSQLIQQTPTKDLLPALHTELKNGVGLKELIAAGALANARAF